MIPIPLPQGTPKKGGGGLLVKTPGEPAPAYYLNMDDLEQLPGIVNKNEG